MEIIRTSDWDDFVFVRENRDILTGKKYNNLLDSIKELGYLISPIIVMLNDNQKGLVDMDDEDIHHNAKPKYIVIDGQHRLTVCRELNTPVDVVINENVKRSDIVTAGKSGYQWNLKDYINFYQEQGNINYIQLDAMIRSYIDFRTSAVIEAFSGNSGGTNAVKIGQYEIDVVLGAKILSACINFKTVIPDSYQQVKMIRALKNIFKRYNNFNPNIVVDILNKNSDLLDNFELKHIPSKDSNMILDIYAKHFKSVDTHSIPQNMREFIIAYFNGRCNYEGCSKDANHVDHKEAYSKVGKTEINNLQLLCASCNLSKGAKNIES